MPAATPPPTPLSRQWKGAAVLLCLLCSSAYTLLITASQTATHAYSFNTASIVFYSILLKFAFSVGMMGAATGELRRLPQLVSPRQLLLFAVPALLFAVDDNLTFYILERLDNATASTTAQSKILFTSVLFGALMGRRYTVVQQVSLLLLFVGVLSAKSSAFECVAPAAHGTAATNGADHDEDDDASSFLVGILLVCFSSFVSSLADVYTEFIMKQTMTDSIHFQNAQLYVWGLTFTGIMTLWKEQETSNTQAIGWLQLLLIVLLAAMGFLTSVIFKHLSVMVKIFVNCGVMLLTAIGSFVWFDFQPNLSFFCGFVTIVCGIFLYNLKKLGIE